MIRRIAMLLFIGLAWGQSKMDINNLIDRGGVLYAPNDDKPFTGIVFDLSKETGSIISKTEYEQGIPHGIHIEWNNDGKKKAEGIYKSGVMDGKWTEWGENEQKSKEGTMKNSEREGLWIEWYENGQKKAEIDYKNGKIISSKYWGKIVLLND